MVSIQRLPITTTVNPQPQKKRAGGVSPQDLAQPTAVAKAVAKSVRDPDHIRDAQAKVQYDVPQGKGRQAVTSYLNVQHQGKRDELAAIVGVDLFV